MYIITYNIIDINYFDNEGAQENLYRLKILVIRKAKLLQVMC